MAQLRNIRASGNFFSVSPTRLEIEAVGVVVTQEVQFLAFHPVEKVLELARGPPLPTTGQARAGAAFLDKVEKHFGIAWIQPRHGAR
ncbi:hypothetical protein [Variovorax guangxiensis]|uniref:hypothetical protein n=1 Tax=Variovorax guangxiensis TaxID=1775474 RepID=UPI002859A113|nr:hypothetical protein [Variovorax guangxiensis]MDR6860778.1 hypothetical protein [Variovorax guangxiensis]